MLSSKPMIPRGRTLTPIGYKYTTQKVLCFIVTDDAGRKSQLLPIYLSNLNSFLMLPFNLLLIPLSCISSLDLLMRLNPTTN